MKEYCGIGRGIELVQDCLALGTDSILLSDFAAPLSGSVCALGCGAGYVMILASLRTRDRQHRLCGVDIRESAIELARENLSRAGLEAELICGDLRQPELLPACGFDVCLSNPPYIPVGSGIEPDDEQARIARVEHCLTVDQLCAAAARILRSGGWFYTVYPAPRLTDMLCAMRSKNLEPKKLRFFSRSPDASPSLALIGARRDSKPWLEILPPLYIGREEHRRIFAPL